MSERSFDYSPAIRRGSPVILGIFGPSGGGKTWSSLRLGVGMQRICGGDLAVIDTETGRALKYADYFKFHHIPFAPPYRSLDYLGAAQFAVSKGAKTIVIDSQTHEHSGIGGYLESADAELDRMAGDNYGKRMAMKLSSFVGPSVARRKMIDGYLALGVNLIMTFRAKEKVKPEKVKKEGSDREKTEIVNLGFMPIGSTELVFEMDAACLLLPHAGGVPTWKSEEVGENMMIKTAEQFTDIFRESKPLSEEIGQHIAEWARGPVKSRADRSLDELVKLGDKTSLDGQEKLKAWWQRDLSEGERGTLGGKDGDRLKAWKEIAGKAAS